MRSVSLLGLGLVLAVGLGACNDPVELSNYTPTPAFGPQSDEILLGKLGKAFPNTVIDEALLENVKSVAVDACRLWQTDHDRWKAGDEPLNLLNEQLDVYEEAAESPREFKVLVIGIGTSVYCPELQAWAIGRLDPLMPSSR